MDKKTKQRLINIGLIVFSIVVYFAVIFPTLRTDLISYDSSYQYALNQKDYSEIMRLIPLDYSPALYSIFLKSFSIVFGDTLTILRASSFIVYMGIILLCIYPVKRAFGNKASLIATICFAMNSSYYLLFYEIRPQVLGLLFISIAAVYTYLVYRDNKKSDYIVLTVVSILAMYTHNVAMFTMFCYYGMLLLFSVLKKNYKQTRSVLISGIICAIAYIPNLIMLIHQFNNVKNNYWSSGKTTFYHIIHDTVLPNIYPWRDSITKIILPMNEYFIALILLLLVSICLVISIIFRKKHGNVPPKEINKDEVLDLVFMILLYWLPSLFFLMIVSVAVHIYAARYMHMFVFIGLLVIIVLVSKFDKKNILAILLSVIIVGNFFWSTKLFRDNLSKMNLNKMVDLIKSENPDETKISFVHSNEWSMGVLMYYFPNANHYITDETFCVLNSLEVFPSPVIDIGSPDNILNYTDSFYTFDREFPFSEWNSGEYYAGYSELNESKYDGVYYGFEPGYYIRLVYFEVNNQ